MGRFKAAYFRSLGFGPNDLDALQRSLRALLQNEAESETPTRYGIKYEVRGTLVGPGGRVGRVVSVWIILSGEEYPRFVTAYPE